LHPVNPGADAATQLGDGYLLCHVCSFWETSGVVKWLHYRLL
jgi:hypothetical protein